MTKHDPDRRVILRAASALALAQGLPAQAQDKPGGYQFPKGFLWGAATAAYQVEGGNINSDSTLLERLANTPFVEPAGDACDHYHLFEQDIALLAKLGLNTYRFSIEWARIEPAPNAFSMAEIQHYRRVLEACKLHGLTTVVTLHHFTSPGWFSAARGFENAECVDLFARYAKFVVAQLGDLIDQLSTFNEANLSFGFNPKLMAEAARVSNSAQYSAFLFANEGKSKPNVRKAHTAATAAVKALRPTLPVGLTLAMSDYQNPPGEQGRAEKIRSVMYDVWLKHAAADDYVGVQTYTRELFGSHGRVPVPVDAQKTQVGFEFYPEALEGTIRYAAAVAGVPVLVTENGVAVEDDAARQTYIDRALAGVQRCLQGGVDVRGYIHWSLLDNFEWAFGYAPKFGLVGVDRATQRRQIKPSAMHLGRIAQRNQTL